MLDNFLWRECLHELPGSDLPNDIRRQAGLLQRQGQAVRWQELAESDSDSTQRQGHSQLKHQEFQGLMMDINGTEIFWLKAVTELDPFPLSNVRRFLRGYC